MRPIYLDIATCPIDRAAEFIEEPAAPEHYKDPVKIADFIRNKKAKLLADAALDPDLGRIAMIGYQLPSEPIRILRCDTEDLERDALLYLAGTYLDATSSQYRSLVGFNSLEFDWPFMVRRAAYLDVPLTLPLDRYRCGSHVDLMQVLSHKGLSSAHSLGFYVKRLGWTDLRKPLSGAEEAMAPAAGRWDELQESVLHDVTATVRLAAWLGVTSRDLELVA